jgi:hypothetical protein
MDKKICSEEFSSVIRWSGINYLIKSILNGIHIAKKNPYHELISISKFRLLHERK